MFAAYLNSQFTLAQYADFFLRIIVSAVCGFALGAERSRRFKEAGVRTHMIVCCAAALMMIVSKYGFADMTLEDGSLFGSIDGVDPARIAAQIVSGISFLGAGMIFKNGTNVKGLTTAAGIWATAGIGMAVGAGMYFIGTFATVFIAIMQCLMHKINIGADAYKSTVISLTVENSPAFQKDFNQMVKTLDATLADCSISRNGDVIRYRATLKCRHNIAAEEINDIFGDRSDVREISVISEQ